VTVSGSDFAGGTTATFGGSPITISNLTVDSFTFTTPPGPPAGGIVYVIVTDSLGSSTATAGAGYLYVPLADYVPLPPFRIFDTRSPPTPLGPNISRTVQVTGVGTTPVPSTAVAVVINVTEVNGTANSLLTVYPYQTPQPTASNLNFNANTITPNLVTVTLGNGGRVSIYNSVGTVNVIVDVEGYFAAPTVVTTAGEFHPILPLRVCDTRSNSPTPPCKAHGILVAGSPMLVTVTGTGANAIPSDGTAAAAVLNLTAVSGSEGAYLTVYPTTSSATCPTTSSVSTINVIAGAVEANRVFVKLGPGPSGPNTAVCVEVSVGRINVVLDANGWFGATGAAAGFQYQAILPSRICDTRKALAGCVPGAIGAGTAAARLVHVAGEGGVPSIASGTVVQAVIANMTAVTPTQNTFLVAYPAGTVTGASDINLSAGATLPNLIVVQLSTTAGANDGAIDILNSAGTVNAVIDIEGWFQ
jgi:serine protease